MNVISAAVTPGIGGFTNMGKCEDLRIGPHNRIGTLVQQSWLLMTSRRPSSPSRGGSAAALQTLKKPPAPMTVSGTKVGSTSPAGSRNGAITPPPTNLINVARKTGSSSPTSTPSTSDRPQRSGSYQKPKPSALAAMRAASSDGGSPQNSPNGGDAIRGKKAMRARASNGSEMLEGEPPATPGSNLVIEVGSANNGADDDVFVPEEEESGAEWSQYGTQGDALMAAKALRKGKKGINSPGLDSPASPVRLLARIRARKKPPQLLRPFIPPPGASISFSHACIAFSLSPAVCRNKHVIILLHGRMCSDPRGCGLAGCWCCAAAFCVFLRVL